MRSAYTVTLTDHKGNKVHQALVSNTSSNGWTFPFTAAGAEEFVADLERAIGEHEAHLDSAAKNEIPM